jgi:hypothetical protein
LFAQPLNRWFFELVNSVFELSGVSGLLWQLGAGLTQFWRHLF